MTAGAKIVKKTKGKSRTTGLAHCKASRLRIFTETFLGTLEKLDDPIEGAETMREMVDRRTSRAERRQLLAGRIALLSLKGRIEAEPEPEPEIIPEPVAAAVEPAPVKPAPPPRKPPVTSILSLEDAAQLFSAFSMSDPDDPPAAPAMAVSAPDSKAGAPPDLHVIDVSLASFEMEMIETEETPPPAAATRSDEEAKAKPAKQAEAPAAKKRSRKSVPAPAEEEKTRTAAAPAVTEEPKPVKSDASPAEGLRAKRSGESRIIMAEDGKTGKPKIDFSALASLGDAPEPEPKAKAIDFSALAAFGDVPAAPAKTAAIDFSALDAFGDSDDAPPQGASDAVQEGFADQPESGAEDPAEPAAFKPGLKIDLAAKGFFDDLSSLGQDDADKPKD